MTMGEGGKVCTPIFTGPIGALAIRYDPSSLSGLESVRPSSPTKATVPLANGSPPEVTLPENGATLRSPPQPAAAREASSTTATPARHAPHHRESRIMLVP